MRITVSYKRFYDIKLTFMQRTDLEFEPSFINLIALMLIWPIQLVTRKLTPGENNDDNPRIKPGSNSKLGHSRKVDISLLGATIHDNYRNTAIILPKKAECMESESRHEAEK